MAFMAVAFPVVPGMEGRAADLAGELQPNRARYEELNARSGVRRHMEWLQPTPMGSLLIPVFEVDHPEQLLRPFGDDAYDTGWLDRLRDVHGVDIRTMTDPPAPPTMVYDWKAEGVD